MSGNPEIYKLREEDHVDNFFDHEKLHRGKTKKDFEEEKDGQEEKEWYFEEDKNDDRTTYVKFVGEVESKAS